MVANDTVVNSKIWLKVILLQEILCNTWFAWNGLGGPSVARGTTYGAVDSPEHSLVVHASIVTVVEAMYTALSQCQVLHPDPEDDSEEEEERGQWVICHNIDFMLLVLAGKTATVVKDFV